MEVFRSLASYTPKPRTVATMGTFDGVHLGHQFILKRIMEQAAAIQGHAVLISFFPHPRLILQPTNHGLRLLHTLEEKIGLLDQLGLDQLLLIPFTRDFSNLSSRAFIEQVLVRTVGAEHIIIGYDHRFGHDRSGDIQTLQACKQEFGFEVEEIPAQLIDDAKISSTKIRTALQTGEVEVANRLLGYRYVFTGTVIHGEKLGRTIGYPTANIQPADPLKLIPGNGVYFVRVQVEATWYYGMMNIGKKPTVGTFERGYEVYIFHFSADIYGASITTEFLAYIRPEQKFDSLEALIKAIDGDRDYCLARIATLES